MKELDYKVYSALRDGSISLARVPKRIKSSLPFKNLLSSKVIDTEKSGRGSRIVVKNQTSFNAFFNNFFSEEDIVAIDKVTNIKKLRDSKARRVKSNDVFFLRGFKSTYINHQIVDLKRYTENFGLFAAKISTISCKSICFVENLHSFLKAEKLFGTECIYLHKYGRIGINTLKLIEATEVRAFVDYDFNGMDEYLRIKSVFPQTCLHFPAGFVDLFDNYSKSIKGKQKQSRRVKDSVDPLVIKVRDSVAKTSRFLEQEVLIND